MITARSPRYGIAARWAKAAERAANEGVRVLQLVGTGVWIATSSTDRIVGYLVTETDCECRAAIEGDPVFKHRATLRNELERLAAKPPVVHPCSHCCDVIDNPTSVEVSLCWSCENDWAWSVDEVCPNH